MKIYIFLSEHGPFHEALRVAKDLKADVLIVDNGSRITAAYPLTDTAKDLLGTLKLRLHDRPEYNTCFYALPFSLYNAVSFLFKKFPLELANDQSALKRYDDYRIGDMVLCPIDSNNTIVKVTSVRPVPPGGESLSGHKQFVTAETKIAALTPKSGYYFLMVVEKE